MVMDKKFLAVSYRSLSLYDMAPESSKGFFGDEKDPQEIRDKFYEKYAKAENMVTQLTLGMAYNYAFTNALFNAGNLDEAQEMVRGLVSQDVFMHTLDLMLGISFGSDYFNECMQQKRLLIPKQLDALLLERHAPKSKGEAEMYPKRDGIMVATEKDGVYLCNGLLKNRFNGISFASSPGMLIGFMRHIEETKSISFVFKGTQEGLEKKVKASFERQGAESSTLILSQHPGMNIYLGFFYYLRNIPGKLREESIRMDAGHGISGL